MLDYAETSIGRYLVPKLLDPAIISRDASLERLRYSETQVLCDPFIYTHWAPYWFGHLHERELQVFLEHVLRTGDSYVDIGTNYGHFAFLAAGLVGSTGTVQAFEPNPKLANLVREHAKESLSAQFSLRNVALGDVEGTFQLSIPRNHLGAASLRGNISNESITEAETETEIVTVSVLRGDSVLKAPDVKCRVLVKVDVEGFEPNVVAGMRKFIRDRAHAVVLEVTPEWIGGSQGVIKLFAEMADLDCEAWLVKLGWRGGLLARRCKPEQIKRQENVYFVKSGFEINCDWTMSS